MNNVKARIKYDIFLNTIIGFYYFINLISHFILTLFPQKCSFTMKILKFIFNVVVKRKRVS